MARKSAPNIVKLVLLNARDRHKKVAAALPQGFTLAMTGRDGYIYYRLGDRILEIYVEMSGVPQYHLLVWPEDLATWVYPRRQAVTPAERKKITAEFRAWLKAQKFKTDFEADQK